ncbi:MAG: hypothetical protein M1820_005358 [Bogoriella megaspora]|nr:MAG: hypothetical protein M1820_005358 [Bogoriella megaspora]
MYNLKGRKVLVTGGARGIGAAIVRKFAAEGSDIAINYLNSQDAAASLAKEMQDEYGINTTIIQGDMSRMADCKALVKRSIEVLGGLDVIISNAGNTKIAPFEDIYALSEEDWDHAHNVLTKSNIFLLQEALPTFNANPDGGVLLIMSSLAGLITNGSSLAYSVHRAAQLQLTQCLAQTHGPKVRVNAVCPGLVDTDRTAVFSEERRNLYKEMAVMKRITTQEEVADTFIYLAKNSGLTGERIRVDSGMAIR